MIGGKTKALCTTLSNGLSSWLVGASAGLKHWVDAMESASTCRAQILQVHARVGVECAEFHAHEHAFVRESALDAKDLGELVVKLTRHVWGTDPL